MTTDQLHTIVALVEDKPGVLTRIAGLFRRRGFNIASLTVGKSEQPGLSRMTCVVDGSPDIVIQATRQLDKLIDVRGVCDITEEKIIARELALIKVQSTPGTRSDIIQIAQMFRAHIVDVGTDSIVVEVTGSEDKIAALQDLLNPYTIIQMMRTGRVAMTRGNNKEV
ncbi:MAG: acetolactate synthase small subunit [SAR202 cluster bacterium]|nr:acetolactate synthase small subunit [SAR202 cluster bacterium]MQG52627.1 acetolactate synthase small subunit [SAR202 cluster bacterium]